ncbi:hypothetical protein LPJ53_005971 [Coemansia erecta]|uniref:Ribosomal protein S2 n=1 Tax=Coemansia erecta TaxID=147472 RepID=A0A9W8CPL7_9FUNG|nr:hypothetical protein LPJ53_005971 [Coemansia erecta]
MFGRSFRVLAHSARPLRQLSTEAAGAATPAASAPPPPPPAQLTTPMPEVSVREFGKPPRRTKKYAAQDAQRIRQHLARLRPRLQQTGSVQTDLVRPSEMLDHESSQLTLEAMMAAGMHLGHCTSLWNPMNLRYILGEREGIHVINLEETLAAVRRAAHFVRSVAYEGGLILFVGSRKEHRQMAVDAALHAEQYFITGKWLPGTLTNPKPLLGKHVTYTEDVWDVEEARELAEQQQERLLVQRAEDAVQQQGKRRFKGASGQQRFMKMVEEEKERASREADSLHTYKPDLIIALNPLECQTMLAECRLAHVPTVGIVDTNCDPRAVSYPVPCNDDSVRAVSMVAGVLARAAKDGLELRRERLKKAVDEHYRNASENAAANALDKQYGAAGEERE